MNKSQLSSAIPTPVTNSQTSSPRKQLSADEGGELLRPESPSFGLSHRSSAERSSSGSAMQFAETSKDHI